MPNLTLLVGPPGSGKSTLANKLALTRVSQDDQGRDGHMEVFNKAITENKDIVIDRMGFVKNQRERYLKPAKEAGYSTEIIVLHESYQTCKERMANRTGHPTIKDETAANQALNMFFSKYERVEDSEADKVTRIWPEGDKPSAIICDLDGTLCNCEHRRHFVRPNIITPGFKKNWKAFFDGIPNDPVNEFCADILRKMAGKRLIVYLSGRDDNQRKMTKRWLEENNLDKFVDETPYRNGVYTADLFMRNRQDSRQDYIVKEILLDFEVLTRFTPYFMLDDRDQVVKMWRRRGFTCLQVAEGDF